MSRSLTAAFIGGVALLAGAILVGSPPRAARAVDPLVSIPKRLVPVAPPRTGLPDPYAPAEGVSLLPLSGNRVFIDFDGDVVFRTGPEMTQRVKDAILAGKTVAFVRMRSPGGVIGGGVEIAKFVRWLDVPIYIDDACASSCALAALAAGPDRIVLGPRGRLGLHQASTYADGVQTPSVAGTNGAAAHLRQAGVPEKVIGRMVRTRPSQIYWIAPADLAQMGVRQ